MVFVFPSLFFGEKILPASLWRFATVAPTSAPLVKAALYMHICLELVLE